MTDRRIVVETPVKGDLDTLWHRTQDPVDHSRWDPRFSEIVQQSTSAGQAQRFRYTVWLPGLPAARVSGTGVSVGERHAADGSRTYALRSGYQYEPGPS